MDVRRALKMGIHTDAGARERGTIGGWGGGRVDADVGDSRDPGNGGVGAGETLDGLVPLPVWVRRRD